MAERRSCGPRKNSLAAAQESGEDPLTFFERQAHTWRTRNAERHTGPPTEGQPEARDISCQGWLSVSS